MVKKLVTEINTSSSGEVSNLETASSSEPFDYSAPRTPKTWKGRVWDSFDYEPRERWFLFKLDVTVLFLGAAGVFLRYLDQTNINNAFVSGMKEELSMYGNQLNYANAAWSVGYIVGQFPSSLLLNKVRPHYVLAFIEITWSVITFATSSVKTFHGLYAARFFLGLIEGGHFPGIIYLTSSWYTKTELSKRTSIIQFCTGVGPMFSGYLQAAAYNGLNGVSGRSGWRWLFIIDGIISLPLAVLTLFLLPDVPAVQRPNFLISENDLELAKKRVPHEIKVHVTYKWKDIIRWFKTWHIYGFSIMFACLVIAGGSSASVPFWFKSYPGEFSIAQINVYPTPLYAIQIVTTVAYSYISDGPLRGKRWLISSWILFTAFPIYLALGTLPVHPHNKHGRWALYYLIGISSGSAAQIWTWVNESLIGDPLKRAFVSTFMNAFSYAFSAWTPILLFPTQDQPYVQHGHIASAVLMLGASGIAILLGYIQSLRRTEGFLKSIIQAPENEEPFQTEKAIPPAEAATVS